MCVPERPQPDNYDGLSQVRTHFCATPDLTQIPRRHRYNRKAGNSIVDKIRRVQMPKVYGKQGLQLCPRHGLYWAGSKTFIENEENDKIMLLVVELKEQDIGKWWKIDGDMRAILEHWELSGNHGVCVRYYLYNENATVHETTHREPLEEAVTNASTPAVAPFGAAPSVAQSTAAFIGPTQTHPNNLNRITGRADAIWQPWVANSEMSRSPGRFNPWWDLLLPWNPPPPQLD